MRILIAGGTQLTGPYAVRRLHALGHRVTVFHRGDHEVGLPPDVRHVHGDFAHPPAELLTPAPDVVVHMWAMHEAVAKSFVDTFAGVAARAVAISSGDVYRAYGCLRRAESAQPDPGLLTEDAPLRTSRYPYRDFAPSPGHWMADYDKIPVEAVFRSRPELPATILRYPAVHGPGEYRRFQRWLQPMKRGDAEIRIQGAWASWRWTHGFAEDVAESVVLAVTNPAAAGRIYNVGEESALTMRERLDQFARAANWRGEIREVPAADLPEAERFSYDFAHHLAYDTTRIRAELGYREVAPHEESLRRTLALE